MRISHACIIFIFPLACTSKEKQIPSDILPVDKMKLVVWNMTQAGEYALYQKEQDTLLKTLNTVYFNEVLEMYQVEKSTFIKSFDYYQSHPSLNKMLFDSVSAYSTRQRGRLYEDKR